RGDHGDVDRRLLSAQLVTEVPGTLETGESTADDHHGGHRPHCTDPYCASGAALACLTDRGPRRDGRDEMTGPLRRLRPPHPLDVLSAVWSTAAATPVAWLVKGRRLTVNIDGADVSLTITDFDPRMDILRLSVGRLGRVELGACDIEWADNRIDRLTAVLHDVHLKPSVRPELVAGPAHLTADIPADVVPVWLASKAPRLSGDIDDDGVARIWLARRPHWGRLEIDARLERSTSGTATDHPADHSALWLHPRAVV